MKAKWVARLNSVFINVLEVRIAFGIQFEEITHKLPSEWNE